MIKRLCILACLAIFTCSITLAQQRHRQRQDNKKPNIEQMIRKKCNELIKALELDNQKAEQFTQTYLSYCNEVIQTSRKYRRIMPQRDEKGERLPLKDSEVEQNILNGFAKEKELVQIKEKFYSQYREFLSPQQIQKLYFIDSRYSNGGYQNGPMGRQGFRPGGGFGGYQGGGFGENTESSTGEFGNEF